MIAIPIGLAVVALLLIASAVAGYLVLHPRPLERWVRSPFSWPDEYGAPYEELAFRAADGISLHGWWVPAHGKARATIIGIAGVASPKTDWSPFAAMVCPRGFNLCMVDPRGHGESAEGQVTWGVQEARDLRAVFDQLQERGYAENGAILVGTSMGASTALRTAADDPRVIAVVAQSAFTSLREAFNRMARRFTGPLGPYLVSVVLFWANVFATSKGFADDSLLAVVGRVRVPTMLVQGTCDTVVTPDHAKRVFEAIASADKRMEYVEGGKHVSLWKRDHPEYHAVLLGFLEQIAEQSARA